MIVLDKFNQRGPDFLCNPKSQWPEEAKVEENMPDVERERWKEQSVLIVTNPDDNIIDCKRFSRWRKLVRKMSYILKFVRKLKSKCKKETDDRDINANGTLT